jgi:hypothetical protein
VVSVAGCTVSNFAISSAAANYFIIFDGAQLPQGDPTRYTALAIGELAPACNGQAIKARQILWYEPTPTPTPPATVPAPTVTPTPTLTTTLAAPTAPAPTAPATAQPTGEAAG